MSCKAAALGLAAALCASAIAQAQEAGQFALELETRNWVNAPAGFTWSNLKGRVVLIERWSTG
jgi:hypothetical protein